MIIPKSQNGFQKKLGPRLPESAQVLLPAAPTGTEMHPGFQLCIRGQCFQAVSPELGLTSWSWSFEWAWLSLNGMHLRDPAPLGGRMPSGCSCWFQDFVPGDQHVSVSVVTVSFSSSQGRGLSLSRFSWVGDDRVSLLPHALQPAQPAAH